MLDFSLKWTKPARNDQVLKQQKILINAEKAGTMFIYKIREAQVNINILGGNIEQLDKFTYLGGIVICWWKL